MNSISNSAALVFCPPLPGKPDSSRPRPVDGSDNRKRVLQKGSKDDTCWYSAANLIRERYKAPNTENLRERKHERIVSTLRRGIAGHHHSLPDISYQLNNDSIKKFLSGLTKEVVANPQKQASLKDLDDQCAPAVSLSSIVPEFLGQDKYQNLYEYLVYKKNHSKPEVYSAFFKQLDINPKGCFESARKLYPAAYHSFCNGKEWEQLGPEKDILLDHFARHEASKMYNLKLSSWHPSQPIEQLITEIQNRGPLIVGGCFGTSHYAVPPRKLKIEVADRPVYGWLKTDPKNNNHVTVHTIVLVGAQKTDKQELVFYIDPEEDSDPSSPKSQKVFCISYSRLTSEDTICDYHGFLRNDSPATIGYAVYNASK